MKQRVISAVVALMIVIPIILYGGLPFYIGCALIGLIGFIEMLNLRGKEKNIPYLMKALSIISFIFIMMGDLNLFDSLYMMDYERVASVIFLIMIPIVFYNKSKKYDVNDALFLLGSVFFLGIGFNQLIGIRISSLYYLIFLLSVTIFSDTFAYVVGKLIGKHKMCPSVSPNKTWEGFAGGLIFSTFISTVLYTSMFDYTGNIVSLVFFVAILSVVGQLGDLVFSTIKRNYNIKDFGNIMPGHGGVLDRLDSIIFVILAFSFLLRFI